MTVISKTSVPRAIAIFFIFVLLSDGKPNILSRRYSIQQIGKELSDAHLGYSVTPALTARKTPFASAIISKITLGCLRDFGKTVQFDLLDFGHRA